MTRISRKRIGLIAAQIALAALALAYLSPLFAHPQALLSDDPSRYHDYLQQATYDHLFRRAILNDHEFPLRTPFLGGGYPLSANPQDPSFSPFSIVPLVLGEALGIKVNILLFFCIGALGFYALARDGFRATWHGAVFGAAAYVLSGWWLSRLEWGFYFKLYFHFVPWIWLGIEKARRSGASVITPALLLAIVLTQLGLGYAVIGLFILAYSVIDAAVRSKSGRRKRALHAAGLVIGVFALSVVFAAAKVLPMADLILKSPRAVEDYRVYAGAYGGYPHFWKDATVFLRSLILYSDVPNEPLAPGWITLLLAGIGIVASVRKHWPLLLVAVWFGLICFGPFLPVDFFRPLWRLPVFHSMHAPYQLFSYFLLLAICLFAAKGFDIYRGMLKGPYRPAAHLAFSLFLLVLIGQAFYLNRPVLAKIFIHPTPALAASPSFYQVQGENMTRGAPRSLLTQQYFNVLRNVGTIDFDGDVLLPENAKPREFIDQSDAERANPDYRGEVYFHEGRGEIESWKFTANSVTADGTARTDAVLVFNQNYDDGFACDRPVMEIDGLLAVKAAQGKFHIVLRYRPKIAYAGMAISLISLLSALAAVLVSRRKKKEEA